MYSAKMVKSQKGMSDVVLSENQMRFYEENGYIILKHFLSDELIKELSQHARDVCEDKVDKGCINVVKEPFLHKAGKTGELSINKLQDLCFDKTFMKYTQNANLLNIVESFLGSNITCISSMYILKPPNNIKDMSVHPLHQDQYYFPYRPAEKMISVWSAFENTNRKNGCLYIIPGSHKLGLLEHGYVNKKCINIGYHGVFGYKDVTRMDLPMEKGDTIIFHPLLLHGSHENRSEGFRRAMNCDYSSSFVEVINMKETVQNNISTELEMICTKKTGKRHTYEEIFQMKSRCVKGSPGNFNFLLQGQKYF